MIKGITQIMLAGPSAQRELTRPAGVAEQLHSSASVDSTLCVSVTSLLGILPVFHHSFAYIL